AQGSSSGAGINAITKPAYDMGDAEKCALIRIIVNNGSTWNRVRIGPIKDLTALNAMRAKLAQNHIEPLVIKIN
ncbi:MAG: SPOR domain-containing protein, partial [Gammaproteobacteria bacterium]